MSRRVLIAGVALGAVIAAAGWPNANAVAAPRRKPSAVGVRTETFVDHARPTPANGAVPAHAGRSLKTTILYPATGATDATPTPNANPARDGGPYPLIVFAHGLGSDPTRYEGLLSRWASAGYVVAAPRFPLTSAGTTGGIDPGDYRNQPGDVTYVITAMLDASTQPGGPLAGLVNSRHVGVAGHSLGGITTLGVAVNTCCHDTRIGAAVVLAGDPLTFPNGHFDYTKAPPILLVHGTDDQLVTYNASVDVFNHAGSPKELLTIERGSHEAPVDPSGLAFASVVRTTTDFFDAYLKGSRSSRRRISSDGRRGATSVRFASRPGPHVTIATAPKAIRRLHASATPHSGLTNGQTVTVEWSGYTPGKTVNIVQCSKGAQGDASVCSLKTGKILQPDPAGHGSLSLQIVVGSVGTGICDATHPGCVIFVNDGGSLDATASVKIPITFAPS